MSASKLFKVFLGLGLTLGLFAQSGCLEELNPLSTGSDSTDSTTDTSDTSSTSSNTDTSSSAASSQTPVLTISSLTDDLTVAQGQTVLLTWQIQNLPANPTVDVLYKATNEQTNKTLISGLQTSNVGSLQIDTYSFIPGLTYTITLQLKSSAQVVASATAGGEVTIASPTLSVTSPTRDTTLLPSSTVTINWTGTYLPAGSELQTFLDLDTTYDNGNEIIVKTDTISATAAESNGSITLSGASLWGNDQILRSNPYYLGLRIIKNGKNTISRYATATLKLYGGENFAITSPLSLQNIHAGTPQSIKWSVLGVPSSLKVQLSLVDRATGNEYPTGVIYAVSAGGATVSTSNLVYTHTYDLVAELLDNTTVIKVAKVSSAIYVTTEGSSIFISNSELLNSSDKVYLGLENTFTIQWTMTSPPANGIVDLYLDADGDVTTTTDQIKISPDGGLTASLGQFAFTPDPAVFTADKTNKDYYVIARLLADGSLMANAVSVGRIRIGAGGIDFTSPVTDVTLTMGNTMNITWATTGDICTTYPNPNDLVLELYIDTVPAYNAATAVRITPIGGLDPCAVTSFTFDPSTLSADQFKADTSYYIIGRLTLASDTQNDVAQVTAAGKIVSPAVTMTVSAPNVDIADNFSTINVTWQIENLTTAGKKVQILAVNSQDTSNIKEISTLYDADAVTTGVADASRLAPGTYFIRCEVFGYDSDGNTISFAQGDAKGKIVIPTGYNGIYQLSYMADAAADPKLGSPIDGTIFEGENIGDLSGYCLNSLGDLDGDGNSDFIIFSRYGKVNNSNKAGAGYLIYGTSSFKPLEKLSSVAASNSNVSLTGTLILLPMENAAMDLGGGSYTGAFKAYTMPDITGDNYDDLMVACPTAMPLSFIIKNNDTTNSVTFTDYYGTTRIISAGQTILEVSHVFPWFKMSNSTDDPGGKSTKQYLYGTDYFPGATITVAFDQALDADGNPTSGHTSSVTISDTRYQLGACYLLTSDRLKLYKNKLFNMTLVGSPVEIDGTYDREGKFQPFTGTKLDQMYAWMDQKKFGTEVGLLPDLNSNGKPELLISCPQSDVSDVSDLLGTKRTAAGVATMFDSTLRGTAYNTGDTGEYWALNGGDPAKGSGRLWWEKTWGSGYINQFFDIQQPLTNLDAMQVDVIGSADNAALTSVSGLTGTSPTAIGGDFDGNGTYDFLVGAPGESGGNGSVYILNLPRFIYNYTVTQFDLAKFNTPYDPDADPNFEIPVLGIKITGDAGDSLGLNVKAIGDFNGDGLADFVIALPNRASSGGAAGAGRIMIVFGKANLPNETLAIDSLTSAAVGANGVNALIFEGINANDHVGAQFCAVYDVNGDGYDDLLIAAPDADDGAKTDCGKIYLIYGRGGIVKTNSSLKQTSIDYDKDGAADGVWSIESIGTVLPGAVFVGEASGDELQTMSLAGDVNGDGNKDFLIAAPNANCSNGGPQHGGKTYLIYGRPFSWPAN